MMETRKVAQLCVLETRWRGTKRNSWGGCKLLRSSTIQRSEGRPDQYEHEQ